MSEWYLEVKHSGRQYCNSDYHINFNISEVIIKAKNKIQSIWSQFRKSKIVFRNAVRPSYIWVRLIGEEGRQENVLRLIEEDEES